MGCEVKVALDKEALQDCDALLLPGGGDIAPFYYGEEVKGSEEADSFLDSVQFAVLDDFVRKDKPVMGICRGLQLLNVYFKGSLFQDLPSAANHVAKDRENKVDNVHAVCCEGEHFLKELYGKTFYVNSWHHQGIKEPGEGIEVLLRAEDGVIEAIRHREKKIFALQFHPERMCLDKKQEGLADGIEIFMYFLQCMS